MTTLERLVLQRAQEQADRSVRAPVRWGAPSANANRKRGMAVPDRKGKEQR